MIEHAEWFLASAAQWLKLVIEGIGILMIAFDVRRLSLLRRGDLPVPDLRGRMQGRHPANPGRLRGGLAA